MKKLFSLAATAVLGAALLLGGCGSTGTSSTGSDAGKTFKKLVLPQYLTLKF